MKHKQTMYRAILVLAGILVIGLLTVWVLPQAGSGQGITPVTLPAGIVYADETAPDVYLPLVITSGSRITTSVQTLSMFSYGDDYDQAAAGPPALTYQNKSLIAAHSPALETLYEIGRSALVVTVPDYSGEVLAASLVFSDCYSVIDNIPTGIATLHPGIWAGSGLPTVAEAWHSYDKSQVVGQLPFDACPADTRGKTIVALNPRLIQSGQLLQLVLRDSEDDRSLPSSAGQNVGRFISSHTVYLVLDIQ